MLLRAPAFAIAAAIGLVLYLGGAIVAHIRSGGPEHAGSRGLSRVLDRDVSRARSRCSSRLSSSSDSTARRSRAKVLTRRRPDRALHESLCAP
ncbi:DoxX family protein [Nocardia sp. NPDC051321]|uniref:DoxX family protein n=1 Tax=Nocardia sp. NPDC051321 TaxID=3364323 RepID=UPI0037A52DF0